jgi:hypothetical protein
MDIKLALASQYHAGLAMLRESIELCPDDLWTSGEHPRNFWRIAYHAVFYTHLYLMTGEDAFQAWEKHRPTIRLLWDDDGELPPVEPPYSKDEVLQYLNLVDSQVDEWVAQIDLASPETGFHWYPIPKLDHQLMNLRHLQGHVGQLSELLMAKGIEIDWVAVRRAGLQA